MGEIFHQGVSIHAVPSDRRLKENITAIHPSSAWDRLGKLKPKSFFYKAKEKAGQLYHGFVAQEFGESYPEAVSETTLKPHANDTDQSPILSIRPQHVIADLVAIVQQQQQQIRALQRELASLKKLLTM